MARVHDVFVLEVDGEFRVRPAVAIVPRANITLRVRNLTRYDAWVIFQDGLLDATQAQCQPLKPRGSKDPAGKKTDELESKLHVSSDGDYGYQVYVATDGRTERALGDSAPKIIVDP